LKINAESLQVPSPLSPLIIWFDLDANGLDDNGFKRVYRLRFNAAPGSQAQYLRKLRDTNK
jgi:hypothetical protein